MALAKLYSTDIPAVIEDILYHIRLGLLKTATDNVATIPTMPKSVRFEGVAIIRLNNLTRTETSSRDATIVTTTAGTSTETEMRSAATSVTDETEQMTYTRTGGENANESSTETGGQNGGQNGTVSGAGTEVETYIYQ